MRTFAVVLLILTGMMEGCTGIIRIGHSGFSTHLVIAGLCFCVSSLYSKPAEKE